MLHAGQYDASRAKKAGSELRELSVEKPLKRKSLRRRRFDGPGLEPQGDIVSETVADVGLPLSYLRAIHADKRRTFACLGKCLSGDVYAALHTPLALKIPVPDSDLETPFLRPFLACGGLRFPVSGGDIAFRPLLACQSPAAKIPFQTRIGRLIARVREASSGLRYRDCPCS